MPLYPKITMKVDLIPGRFRNLTKTYDILHFHRGLSFPLFSLFLQKPKILHLHGLNYDRFKRYFPARFILRHAADMYISLTKSMKHDLVRLGIPKARIRRLPNCVNVEVFHPSRKKEDDLILFVGRINAGKGLHVLLEALKCLKHPVRLVVIGPPGWDSKYFNQMLRLIEKENLKGKHKVEYDGDKSQKDIVEWYQRASIFVLPPVNYEALGIVNLEALACETPVIATNVGGIPEVIHSGENGILVKPNDAIKLADAIQYLLDNESIRKKFGKEGRKLVVSDFSTKAVIRKLVKIYEQLIQ